MHVQMSQEVRKICPDLSVGILTGQVCVKSLTDVAYDHFKSEIEQSMADIKLMSLYDAPQLVFYQHLNHELGIYDSKRCNCLCMKIRELMQENYETNQNVSDILNLFTLKSLYSVNSYDLETISHPIQIVLGDKNTPVDGFHAKDEALDHTVVYQDDYGPFGSLAFQSDRAMVTRATRRLLVVIPYEKNDAHMEEYLNWMKDYLIEYAHGEHVQVKQVN